MIRSVMSKMGVEEKKVAAESQTIWKKRLSSQLVVILVQEDIITRVKMLQNSEYIHKTAQSLLRSFKLVRNNSLLRFLTMVRVLIRRQQVVSLRQAGASRRHRLISSISLS